jgi:hypothetical protein
MVVYALVEPETNLVRYIGQSKNPRKRFIHHLFAVKDRNTYSKKWIASLKSRGLFPSMHILEYCDSQQDLDETEKAWISLGRELEWPLTNLCDGGSSGGGRFKPLEKVIEDLEFAHGDTVQINEKSYRSASDKAEFIDKDFGAWTAVVCDVTRGNRHPQRAKKRRRKGSGWVRDIVRDRKKEMQR